MPSSVLGKPPDDVLSAVSFYYNVRMQMHFRLHPVFLFSNGYCNVRRAVVVSVNFVVARHQVSGSEFVADMECIDGCTNAAIGA